MDRPGRKEQVFILPKSVEVGKSHCCRFSILMSAEMERNAETWGSTGAPDVQTGTINRRRINM